MQPDGDGHTEDDAAWDALRAEGDGHTEDDAAWDALRAEGDGHTEDDAAWDALQDRVQEACRSVSERPDGLVGLAPIPRPPPLPRIGAVAGAPAPEDPRATFTPFAPPDKTTEGDLGTAGSSVAPVALDQQTELVRPSAQPDGWSAPGWRSIPTAVALVTMGALMAFALQARVQPLRMSPAAMSQISTQLAELAADTAERDLSVVSSGAERMGWTAATPPSFWQDGSKGTDADDNAGADPTENGGLDAAATRIGVPMTVISARAPEWVVDERADARGAANNGPTPTTVASPDVQTPAEARATGETREALGALSRPGDWLAADLGNAGPGSTAFRFDDVPRTKVPSTEQQIRPTRLSADRASSKGRLRVP